MIGRDEKTPDMWDDCRRRAEVDRLLRQAVERQNEAMREVRALRAEREAVDARIAARLEEAGCIDAAVEVDCGRSVLTLGPRGEVQLRRVLSPASAVFGAAEASGPATAAHAATDAPSADDDLRAAAGAFTIAADELREAAFRGAVEAEFGPGGVGLLRSLIGGPGEDEEDAGLAVAEQVAS